MLSTESEHLTIGKRAMSHLLRQLHTFERSCQQHYRRGFSDALKLVAWAVGIFAFFAFYFYVGGAPQ